jgi:radical SAM protein with 4Fe4S-binding SPASM domain
MDPVIYPQMRVGGKLKRAKEVIWELVKRGHPNIWVRRVLTQMNKDEPFFEKVKEEWGDKVHVSEHACFDRNATKKHEIVGCDHDESSKRKYCQYPSQRLVITSRGLAYPCCIDLHETMPVGDINKQTILEIWNGNEMQTLRENLRSLDTKKWSKTCQNCESWMSYDSPQRDFVQDRDAIKIV